MADERIRHQLDIASPAALYPVYCDLSTDCGDFSNSPHSGSPCMRIRLLESTWHLVSDLAVRGANDLLILRQRRVHVGFALYNRVE